ncbi:MAG: phage/plasmid primase, P4 family [Humidesulfovibrio sp.]
MSSGDTTLGTSEEMARRVQARVEQESAAASPPPPAKPLPDSFILDCLRANRVGDAILFNTLHRGKFIYVKRWGRFLRWAGHHWAEDMDNADALAEVEAVCEEYLRVMANLSDEMADAVKDEKKAIEAQREALHKRVFLLRDVSGRERLLTGTHTIRDPLSIYSEELDKQPYLLAFKNGVVDLRTGDFRPGRPDDYILNACPIEWESINAPCEPWIEFLSSCHDGNQEVVDFLHRLLGYGVLGTRDDAIWTVFYGARGRNGKDTLLKIMTAVLGGELSGIIPIEMLLESKMPKNSAAPSPDMLALRGRRMAFASEGESNQRMAMAKIKALTGNSFLQGRGLQDKLFTTWKQSHLLFLLTNEIPRSKADDDAYWTRFLAVPWKIRFVDNPTAPDERPRDPHMEQKLMQCLPGIAAWLVRGALEYQAQGLNPPEVILACAREQRDSVDDVGLFLRECCELELAADGKEPETRTGATELLEAFNWWFHKERDSSYSYSPRRFGEIMTKKQFSKKKSNGNVYLGVSLKEDVAADFLAWQDASDSRGEDKPKRRKLFG